MQTLFNESSPVTVAVFGGSGFLGTYVVQRLADVGMRVRVITRGQHDARPVTAMGKTGQIVYVQGNIHDRGFLENVLTGCHAVINLVGILFEKGLSTFKAVHTDFPGHLALCAHTKGIAKFIHVSALGADVNSNSHYAKTKALGEMAVAQAFPQATFLRPSVLFGPEDDFFNRFARLACISPVLPLVGGASLFQPLYVDDVAAAIVKCLEIDEAEGQTYELGGPQVLSLKTLMTMLLGWIGRTNPIIEMPLILAQTVSLISKILPTPLLTHDQIRLLQKDNIVSPNALGFDKLDINPKSVESIVPLYTKDFKKSF